MITGIDLAFGHDSNLYWEKLLESKYIVVLGEAGSGKSWEFNAQAKLLKSNKEFAFSLRLENLVDRDLSHTLDASDEASYQEWHQSEKPTTFFLDSIDEAKLKNHNARLNLQALVSHLQTLADNIQQQNGNVYGLDVISFDFTDPSHQ